MLYLQQQNTLSWLPNLVGYQKRANKSNVLLGDFLAKSTKLHKELYREAQYRHLRNARKNAKAPYLKHYKISKQGNSFSGRRLAILAIVPDKRSQDVSNHEFS